MNTMPSHPRETDAIIIRGEEKTSAFFGGVSQGASTVSIVFWSMAQSGRPSTHPE